MITYMCGRCKEQITAVKENTAGIVYFDTKYWHKDCFVTTCNERMGNKRFKKYNWKDALDDIPKWQEEAGQSMKLAVERDDVYNFIVEHYRISCTNNALYTRLSSIYNGTYHGLLYPISPEELLAEWEFYLPELETRRRGTNRIGEYAVNYDLAVLLSKNVEYRELMAKKKIEEHIKESEKDIVPDVDHSIMARLQQNAQKQKRNNRRSELFKEVMGSGD